jgi:glutamate racemase
MWAGRKVNERPIGVFDSGVGGLSVLRAVRAELPHEDLVYVADSGHARRMCAA